MRTVVNMAGTLRAAPARTVPSFGSARRPRPGRRVVEAAAEVFGENGYQAATFAQIAKRAGVSVETVQKHGPKSALMWAAVEFASFGVEGEIDIFNTDARCGMLEARDPDEFAQFVGETMLTINEPAAGVWTALTGAAHGDE